MPRSLEMTITEVQTVSSIGMIPTFKQTITITDSDGLDTEIFVVQKTPSADNPDLVTFRMVAAASDLTNLSAGSPPVEDPTAPYRVDSLEVTFNTHTERDKLLSDIRRRIKDLLAALSDLDSSGSVSVETFSG